jgi:3-hydroxyisobutyrate dehydrogenase-like beta-hydroxyacid dehydrogenase
MKAQMMLKDDYPPSFRLALAARDARLAVAAGEEAGAAAPAVAIERRVAATKGFRGKTPRVRASSGSNVTKP